MANFSINNSTGAGFGGTQQNMTTTFKTICLVGVGSSSETTGAPSGGAPSPYNPRRGKIYDILIGTNGTPADNFCTWDMSRATALGSSTTSGFVGAISSVSSAFALDPADGLIQAYAVANSSVETNLTYSNSVWSVGVNQRASYRWVAAPGSEFVYPATSSAGFGARMLSGGYTGTATVTLLFQEQ
jgi:hypothetical protein